MEDSYTVSVDKNSILINEFFVQILLPLICHFASLMMVTDNQMVTLIRCGRRAPSYIGFSIDTSECRQAIVSRCCNPIFVGA